MLLKSRPMRGPAGRQQQARSSRISWGDVSWAPRRVAVAAGAAPPGADLRQLLAAKESQLAALFESGQPMPQAGVVAALRAEIAALDDQINGRPVQQYVPSAPVSRGPGPPAGGRGAAPSGGRPQFASPSYMAMPASANQAVDTRTRTEQLADKAYDLVQQQLDGTAGSTPAAAPTPSRGPGMSPAAAAATYILPPPPGMTAEEAEIAQLQADNSALRAEAYTLLKRQQQLETLLEEVRGAKPPELLLETTEDLLARMKAKLQKS